MINNPSRLKASLSAIVLLILSALFAGPPRAVSAENPMISIGTTGAGEKGIVIKATDVSLRDLLNKMQAQSGVSFKINRILLGASISVEVEAENWNEAVQKVLKGYNRVELWGEDRQLTGVYVVAVLDPDGPHFAEPSLPGDNHASERVADQKERLADQEITLSKGQLVKLVRGPYRRPLSSEFWEDEQLRGFLNQHGIQDREDLKNLKKAMTIRKAARKQLLEIRKNQPPPSP